MTEEIYTKEKGHYLQNNPTWHVEDSPYKAKQVSKMLERNKMDPKTIAEIGCGAGEILNQLHRSLPTDVTFTGYDVSIDAINMARQREKDRLAFRHENFLETNQEFDLLLMIDVFEHVDDYLGFLRKCNGKAKNTIFHIPLDINVQGILRGLLMSSRRSVGHLHYFTKETAIATLTDSGYEVVDFFYTPGLMEHPGKKITSKITALFRRLLYSINKDFAAKTIGGFSLMVLAK
ncbi:MAG: class I SAM-dependent methyltransferase [Ferruginibacter sp.]